MKVIPRKKKKKATYRDVREVSWAISDGIGPFNVLSGNQLCLNVCFANEYS